MKHLEQKDISLIECETLKNSISTKIEQRLKVVGVISAIYAAAMGWAMQYNTWTLIFFLPFFTMPLFFLYIFLYVEEGVIRKYIKQKFEDDLKYCGWECYWYGAKCTEEKEREKLKKMGWMYTQLPIYWIGAISFIPAFSYYVYYSYYHSLPHLKLYTFVVLFYLCVCHETVKTIEYLLNNLFKDMGFKDVCAVNPLNIIKRTFGNFRKIFK